MSGGKFGNEKFDVNPEFSESDKSALLMGWEPIETAPKDGDEILLYSMGDIGVCYWRDDQVMTGWTWGLKQPFNLPSHWMPLPEPPAH